MTSPNGTQAVDRAAQLLIQVVHRPGPVTFTELTAVDRAGQEHDVPAADGAGAQRPGAAATAGGGFRPGEVFVSYAWRGGAEAGLITVAQPFLDRLGEATGETINLGVASRGVVEQIAQVDSTLPDRRDQLGRPVGAAALRGARQGAAGLRRGRAAARPAQPAGPRRPITSREAWRPTWPRCAAAATR